MLAHGGPGGAPNGVSCEAMEAAHRESRGCRCWEMTAALWSAGQRVPEPGGDLETNPGWI